jgi:hypothetical protein
VIFHLFLINSTVRQLTWASSFYVVLRKNLIRNEPQPKMHTTTAAVVVSTDMKVHVVFSCQCFHPLSPGPRWSLRKQNQHEQNHIKSANWYFSHFSL